MLYLFFVHLLINFLFSLVKYLYFFSLTATHLSIYLSIYIYIYIYIFFFFHVWHLLRYISIYGSVGSYALLIFCAFINKFSLFSSKIFLLFFSHSHSSFHPLSLSLSLSLSHNHSSSHHQILSLILWILTKFL